MGDHQENFNRIHDQIGALQRSQENIHDFAQVRQEIIKLQKVVKETDLHPNASRKFDRWLSKLFLETNKSERDFFVASVKEISATVSRLESEPTSAGVDLRVLQRQCVAAKEWCSKKHRIFTQTRNADKAAINKLSRFGNTIEDLLTRLQSIQRKRSIHFHNQRVDFESNLTAVEARINELDPHRKVPCLSELWENLKSLQDQTKQFNGKIRQEYWAKIDALFQRLKALRAERANIEKQLDSQSTRQRFDQILDEIEESINKAPVTKGDLRAAKRRIRQDVWNVVQEKDTKGAYAIKLVKSDRDQLFDTMRALFARIDQTEADLEKGVQAEYQKNKQHTEKQLAQLYGLFVKHRDEYSENMRTNKTEVLSSLGSITESIMEIHKQLKTGHYSHQDKCQLFDASNDLWDEVNRLCQQIAQPAWSAEWLQDKMDQNKSMKGVILQVVDSIPAPR